jgi:hypothetical protein
MEIFLVLVVVGGEEKRDSTILELAQLLDVYDDLFPAKTEKTGQETAQVDPLQLAVPKLSERLDVCDFCFVFCYIVHELGLTSFHVVFGMSGLWGSELPWSPIAPLLVLLQQILVFMYPGLKI